jgi:hypothetical protein
VLLEHWRLSLPAAVPLCIVLSGSLLALVALVARSRERTRV